MELIQFDIVTVHLPDRIVCIIGLNEHREAGRNNGHQQLKIKIVRQVPEELHLRRKQRVLFPHKLLVVGPGLGPKPSSNNTHPHAVHDIGRIGIIGNQILGPGCNGSPFKRLSIPAHPGGYPVGEDPAITASRPMNAI
jgi:hypothetical protein